MFMPSKQPENQATHSADTKGSFFARKGIAFFSQAKPSEHQPGIENKRITGSESNDVLRTNAGDVPTIQRQVKPNIAGPKPIKNGGEIVEALKKTTYGNELIKILENSELEYKINIQAHNNGKFGDPKKI